MLKKTIQILFGVFIPVVCSELYAQLAYTTDQYAFFKESDLVYGTAVGFDGLTDTLKLDIYKPLGDGNCYRPVLVLVHGGAWLAGSKEEGYIPGIAEMFAKRGWVVAAINYRLGMHKRSNYTQYALCSAEPCSYFADSSEIIRAIYRGQQDLKGAIRFMKNRHNQDSTDIANYYSAGESAGAFNVLTATFLNNPSEKYAQAFAITDAPTPDADLINCLEPGYSLVRPDLGSIDGELHLGTYDSDVQGVGSIYGGLLNFDLLQDETAWPAMYFFHQGSDVVVHYNFGRILGRMDWECFSPVNLCQTYSVAPSAYGGKGIRDYLQGLSNPPVLTADIIENYSYGTPSANCTANGHSIDNTSARIQNMIETFAVRIASNGNWGASCQLSVSNLSVDRLLIYPNPAKEEIRVDNVIIGSVLEISDLSGKVVCRLQINQAQGTTIHTGNFTNGMYLIRCSYDGEVKSAKLLINK